MKAIKIVIVALFLFASSGMYAQSNSKIIAVLSKASWCPTCQANDDRVMTEVFTKYKASEVAVAANDLSNEKTKAESRATLEKLGVYDLVANDNKTGQIILIDRKTKKVITKISVAKSNDELKKAFDKAIKQS
jgi:ABC-type Na+ efflux pump permease subunit